LGPRRGRRSFDFLKGFGLVGFNVVGFGGGGLGRVMRNHAAVLKQSLKLFGAASETRFLMEQVRQDFRFHQTREGDGHDLCFGGEMPDDRGKFGFVPEFMEFRVEKFDFEAGNAVEAPAEVGELRDEFGVNRGLRTEASGVALVVIFVGGGILEGEEGIAGRESVGGGVGGGV